MMRAVWVRNRLVVALICLTILVWISLSTLLPTSMHKRSQESGGQTLMFSLHKYQNVDSVRKTRSETSQIEEKIKSIAKNIYKAKQHVRGSKTSDSLKEALETMTLLLHEINVDPQSVYNRPSREPMHVCPEKYMGSTFGYPFFYKGFERTECEKGRPIWKLVTIIKHVNVPNQNIKLTQASIKRFVSSVFNLHGNFSVILSINASVPILDLKKLYPGLNLMISNKLSDGMALNKMSRQVKTPYVFVARDIEFLTNDSRLERLVREIESLDIKVAGGAFRDPIGHWKKGCFQSVYRNSTLKYLEGYDESKHECIFCDFIQGPFVARKDVLESIEFENVSVNEGLFEDWFLKISKQGGEAIVCPDSMFHINGDTGNNLNFLTFMKKWDLYKVVSVYGTTEVRQCNDRRDISAASQALSPCAVKFNADAVKTIMQLCQSANIYCELQEGTALGAVKLGKTLPWERDADLTFLTANYSAFQNLKSDFESKGFSFSDLGATWCCVDNRKAGGKFKLGYKGWIVELYGQHLMDSELMMTEGMDPTKVLLDGQWVNVPRNPGLFVRNRYGREIYQHAEHWMTTGSKSGWATYKTNTFSPCGKPGSHNCLDRCNADGDLPFQEMLP